LVGFAVKPTTDTFAQFPHARFQQEHARGEVCQSPTGRIDDQAGIPPAADVGHPLIEVRRHAGRQAAAGDDEVRRRCGIRQQVEAPPLLLCRENGSG
jgi:hypothetical protein